jgi:hypothetical protein
VWKVRIDEEVKGLHRAEYGGEDNEDERRVTMLGRRAGREDDGLHNERWPWYVCGLRRR